MPSRRAVLAGVAALASSAYIHSRGLRYPRLSLEPVAQPSHWKTPHAHIQAQDLIATPSSEALTLRAIAPEPRLAIEFLDGNSITVDVGNIAHDAVLQVEGSGLNVNESVNGINRQIEIRAAIANKATLKWFLPEQLGTRFAVIGDTGGGQELEWCLRRAEQLQAGFLLHLGDFNYGEDEYPQAIELFHNAPVPCYVAIGNHDFNDKGLVYQQFLAQIGPFNHHFSFAGTQFINIDTAVDLLPAYGGQRGDLLDALQAGPKRHFDQVCFTHRNFVDPRPGKDHVIGRGAERRWLADRLKQIGVQKILTGHVHQSAELEYRNLQQYTVGEGLGFDDIVYRRRVCQILTGELEYGRRVKYNWHALNMPWAMHTSPEHEEKLLKEYGEKELEWYRQKLQVSETETLS